MKRGEKECTLGTPWSWVVGAVMGRSAFAKASSDKCPMLVFISPLAKGGIHGPLAPEPQNSMPDPSGNNALPPSPSQHFYMAM